MIGKILSLFKSQPILKLIHLFLTLEYFPFLRSPFSKFFKFISISRIWSISILKSPIYFPTIFIIERKEKKRFLKTILLLFYSYSLFHYVHIHINTYVSPIFNALIFPYPSSTIFHFLLFSLVSSAERLSSRLSLPLSLLSSSLPPPLHRPPPDLPPPPLSPRSDTPTQYHAGEAKMAVG